MTGDGFAMRTELLLLTSKADIFPSLPYALLTGFQHLSRIVRTVIVL